MDFKRIQDDEYELQYYEFSSTNFITEFKDLILGTIKAGINDLEKNVFSNLPQDVFPMSNQFNHLIEEYKVMIQETFKKIEDEIRSFFAIPKHILLPEDENNIPCSKLDIKELDGEIKKLEEIYMKERAFNYLCKKELDILNNFVELNSKIKCFVKKLKPNTEVNDMKSTEGLVKIHQELSNKLSLFNTKFICK